MNSNNLAKALAAAVLLLAVGSLPAIMIPMSGSELDARSDVIVTGTVTGTSSEWNETRTLILTDVKVKVDEVEKGAVGSEITVRIPGGEVGDIGLAVEDMPVLKTGQKVRLNLILSTDAGVFELLGGGQGAIAAPPLKYYSYTGYHRSPASISYHVNSALPGDWVTEIRTAGETWNAAGSAFRYNYGGSTGLPGPVLDGYNVIWRNDLGAGGTIAANYYWYSRKTKIIVENDIIFNSQLAWSTSGSPGAFDVQNIAIHELGHCLCLNDLYKSYQGEMTMYGYASAGETKKRTLEFGDIDGIRFIYGLGQDRSRGGAPTVND